MILKQGHTYRAMPHDGKVIRRIYRGGRCYYIASPYSPEATQALKAAFPAYFAEICDYGYAHPQLVPFINEDPMLIVSLVEVGKTRWLKSDGNAYIDTGIAPRSNHRLHIPQLYWGDDTDFKDYDRNAGLAYTDNGSTGNQGWGFNLWGDTLYVGFGNYATAGKVSKNTKYDFDLNKGAWKVTAQGGTTMQGTLSGAPTPTYNLLLFAWHRSGKVPYRSKMYADKAEMYEDDILVRDFIPMQHPTEGAGMLDIVSLTFHPNANTQGTFTIAITDKE